MKKSFAILVLAMALIAVPFVYAGEFSHSLKSGSTSFTLRVLHPKKIILFPQSQKVSTSYSIVCFKGAAVSRKARSFTSSYTRNLLYQIPQRQDVCYLAIAGATPKDIGQIVVDTWN